MFADAMADESWTNIYIFKKELQNVSLTQFKPEQCGEKRFLVYSQKCFEYFKNSMFAQLLSAVTSLQSTVKRQLLTRLDRPSLMFTLVCRCACESSYFILKSLKAYLLSSVSIIWCCVFHAGEFT